MLCCLQIALGFALHSTGRKISPSTMHGCAVPDVDVARLLAGRIISVAPCQVRLLGPRNDASLDREFGRDIAGQPRV